MQELGRVSLDRALSIDLFFGRDLRNTVRLRIFYAKTLVASKLANCKESLYRFVIVRELLLLEKL